MKEHTFGWEEHYYKRGPFNWNGCEGTIDVTHDFAFAKVYIDDKLAGVLRPPISVAFFEFKEGWRFDCDEETIESYKSYLPANDGASDFSKSVLYRKLVEKANRLHEERTALGDDLGACDSIMVKVHHNYEWRGDKPTNEKKDVVCL